MFLERHLDGGSMSGIVSKALVEDAEASLFFSMPATFIAVHAPSMYSDERDAIINSTST